MYGVKENCVTVLYFVEENELVVVSFSADQAFK